MFSSAITDLQGAHSAGLEFHILAITGKVMQGANARMFRAYT
jgi:hypothetical protein